MSRIADGIILTALTLIILTLTILIAIRLSQLTAPTNHDYTDDVGQVTST